MKTRPSIGKGIASLIAAAVTVTLMLSPVVSAHAAQAYKVGGGINGHPLKLIIYDDKGDSTQCVIAVRKLINRDKVCAIIGPSLSGLSLSVIPVVQKSKIPNVSCAASYKIVTKNPKTGEQWKWVFKTPQSDSMAVEAIYTRYGMTIVADEKYGPKDTDMTAQLTKIKGMSPQAIVNWSIGPTQVVVVRNWKELGMTNIKMYQSHGFGSRKNIKLAAGAAEGIYCPLGACNIAEILPANHPQKQVTMAYVKAYTEKYNEPVSSFGGHAWDALSLVVKALKAVGPDKAKIRDYLENIRGFVGQHGVFNFSPKDHNGLSKEAFRMVVVKKGDWALAD